MMMHRVVNNSKSLVKSGGKLSVLFLLKSQKGLVEKVVVSDVGGVSSAAAAAAAAMGSRRFFNAGGRRKITTESSSLMKTGGCVPHQCNKSRHMLPCFARALASSSASQSSSGQTPRQEPEKKKKKKKDCQIKRSSSELPRERCDEISSTKVSLNQFPGLMVHGIVEDSKTRRLLRLNPDTGCFEEEKKDVVSAAAASNHLQVPNGHVCRGSAYGWLFLTDDNFDMKLFNPFSGAQIQLPPIETLPRAEGGTKHHLGKFVVSKAVFSANPSIDPRPVVLVIYGISSMPQVAFCKPGDQAGWTSLEFPQYSFHRDAIYHKCQFYVLGYPGSVVAFDIGRRIDDDDHSVKTVIVAANPEEKTVVCLRNWYLVVLDGELVRFELRQACFRDCCIRETMQLLKSECKRDGDTSDEDYYDERMQLDGDTTDKVYSDEESDDDDGRKIESWNKEYPCINDQGLTPHGRKKESWKERYPCIAQFLPLYTYGIKIRRFDAIEKEWVKVESLGGKAVFLGFNTSFAPSASDYPAGLCIPNTVYFCNCCGASQYSEKRWYDVGVYSVKDKRVRPKPLFLLTDDDASGFIKPAPIWIVNSAAVSAESDR